MANVPELVAEPDEGLEIQAWLAAKQVELVGFVEHRRNDEVAARNIEHLQQLETIQHTERTPEELELWQRFKEVEALQRGLVDVDKLPSVDEQLTTLQTDATTTAAVIEEARHLIPTSLFAGVLHEKLAKISSDLQLRILHLKKAKAAPPVEDPLDFLMSEVPHK